MLTQEAPIFKEEHESKGLNHFDQMYSGYFPVDAKGQDMFYALVESRDQENKDTDPLLVWLRGAPGCSPSA